MIKLITGEKGTGKTKIMLDMMNEATATSNGSLVCIEKGSNLRTQINYKIRWCDTDSEYYQPSWTCCYSQYFREYTEIRT